eukprot:TRINITY_DN14737_c0_g1_i1.p1 TRINITY_DN14737_c0_g1~~TRINITY_DN14737_c0_g1_i1.p1  ORF type:complete len:453 (+),score=94.45 TRINITY_DN14737_c0_g1_i1:129-1361(+)
MPRRRRPPSRTSTVLRYTASTVCCVLAPLGCASMLLWAWVIVNFRDAPEYGLCVITDPSYTRQFMECSYVPGWWQQWEASLPGITIIPDSSSSNRSCTLVHSTRSERDCLSYLRKWNGSNMNTTCWRVVEQSWWFGPKSEHCYEDQPRGPDVFDRALPLICAGVILIVSLYFWVTCWLRRRGDRRRRDRERAPLLEEMGQGTSSRGTQVTAVAQLRRADGRAAAEVADRVAGGRSSAVVTVSAVWIGPSEAAVVMGDARGGSYPCEVERVYDVTMSAEELCSVCLCEPKQVVLWPCRHMCACSDCAPKLRRCPLCRKSVARRLRLELQPLPSEDEDACVPLRSPSAGDADRSSRASDTSSSSRSSRGGPASAPGPAAAPEPGPAPPRRATAASGAALEYEQLPSPRAPHS